MRDALVEQMRKYFEGQGITQKDIAKQMGVSPTYINKLLTGNKSFGKKTAQQFQDLYGLSPAWLLTGEGEMLVQKEEPTTHAREDMRPRLPARAIAGALNGFDECVKEYDCELVPVIRALPPYDYTILIKGDSMEPKFEGGDEIAIRRVYDYIEWGNTYVLNTREGTVIKRLYDSGKNFKCVSFNPDYPPFEIFKDDVIGIYKIVGLIRINN